MNTAALRPKSILIVDDEPAIRNMYAFKFEHEGFDVNTAENGKTGLKKARDIIPDIILLDLRMPVMDGLTMLQKLRAEDWSRNIRVLILTNISRSEAPSELQFLSVSRYVVKAHHTPAQVVQIIRETL